MRSVTYSMGVSLDGYIVGPDGYITAAAPDEGGRQTWSRRSGTHSGDVESSPRSISRNATVVCQLRIVIDL